MKKYLAAALALALSFTATPSKASAEEVIRNTVTNSATTLTAANKTALTKLISLHPAASRFACVGYTKAKPTTNEKSTALKKAKAVCDFAKTKNRALAVTSTTAAGTATQVGKIGTTLRVPYYPAKALTLDNLDPTWVARVATSRVLDQLAAQRTVLPQPNYLVSANAPAASVAKEKQLLAQAMRMWSGTFTRSFNVVLFSEKDGAWADKTLSDLGVLIPGGITGFLNQPGVANECILGLADVARDGTPVFFNCLHSSGRRYSVAEHTPAHEHFHMVQNSLYKPNTFMPLWVNEGAPTFFGFALGYGAGDRNGRFMERFFLTSPMFDPNLTGVVDTGRFALWAKTGTDAEIVAVYKALEGDPDPESRGYFNQYGLGGIAAQALIAVYGIDKYLDFIRGTNQMDWKASFEATFGLTTDAFYLKLAPFVRALGKKYL